LLDERGNAIGVAFSKLNAQAVFAATGDLPENVNYAITSDVLLRFLQAVPEVVGKLKSPNQDTGKFLDVVKSGETSAAQVHASVELPWYHPSK
jgi:hypothetical protein